MNVQSPKIFRPINAVSAAIFVAFIFVLFKVSEIEQLQKDKNTRRLVQSRSAFSVSPSNKRSIKMNSTILQNDSRQSDKNPVNEASYRIRSTGPNGKPHLVLGILSSHKHLNQRLAQRNTWISAMTQLKDQLPFRVTYKFLLDGPTNSSITENNIYNDIVYLNVSSHGWANRFGEKLYFWLKYLYYNYPDVALGARMDDDVYLCMPQMIYRLYELTTPTLYYGWTHENPRIQIDEMLIVLGKDLIKRIAKRKFCGKWTCSKKNQLSETDYGDTALVKWLSIYNDVDRHADNNRMAVFYRGHEPKIIPYITKDSCVNYILFHKTTPEQAQELYRFNMIQNIFYRVISNMSNTENGIQQSVISSLSSGATSGSEFLGNVVRPLVTPISIANTNPTNPNDMAKTCMKWLKWAVVTTTFSPSNAVKLIANLSDWCIVIVADLKTPNKTVYLKNLNVKNTDKKITFLTIADQQRLYPLLSDAIPFNSYGRKNLGYMFAIQNSAQFIWDFDDDNYGIIDLKTVRGQSANASYVQACDMFNYKLVNPYPYFGVQESRVWPRGFPLQSIKDKRTIPKLCKAKGLQVGIVQSLANGQADVDAIYRLTREVPFTFTAKSHPALVIPKNSFSPFNAQATLWSSSTFELLALPISVHGRVSDIWRSYIAQHFMHRNNIHLAFVPPHVYQDRNPHTLIRDFNAERDLYEKSDKLVSFLSSPDASNYDNILELYEALYVRKYIEQSDLRFIKAWQATMLHVQ